MLAKRHLLVLVFAGGCLSGATLIGVWPDDAETAAEDASRARTAERQRDAPSADPTDDHAHDTVDPDDDAASDDPAPPKKTAGTDASSPKDAGSSVAEILARLEVAYRQGLAAAPAQPAAMAPPAPAPEISTHVQTTVAVALPSAPPANAPAAAPPAAAPKARAPEAEEEQPLASRDDARPRDVHIGDVNQNTHVGDVYRDVYVIQPYPYIPYFAVSPHAARAFGAHRGTPRFAAPSDGTFSYPATGVFKYPVDLVH